MYSEIYKDLYKDVVLTELPKLLKLMNSKDIPYDIQGHNGGVCIQIPSRQAFDACEKTAMSVICHNGSYGHEQGKFEIYAPGLNEGVEGWLDAEEAFSYIQDTLNGISRGSNG